MDKKYIFITGGIVEIGGAELYIYNKAKWLIEQGWNVHVFSSRLAKDEFKISFFEKYKNEILPILRKAPFECSSIIVKNTVNKMIRLGFQNNEVTSTIIESHLGSAALWGELLAQRTKSKHMIDLIDEHFTGIVYKEKANFFYFKQQRGELLCMLKVLNQLLGKYQKYTQQDVRTFNLQENPIADEYNAKLDLIKKADYTICYIGRTAKPYFPNICEGVRQFADNCSNQKIQFVIIGNTYGREAALCEYFHNARNIKIIELGDVIPIPRDLYRKIDVVIANSGSARCSAYEGVPTIIADPEECKAAGVLGYDTTSCVYRDPRLPLSNFSEALVSVLIEKKYKSKSFSMPKQKTVEECCNQNFEMIAISSNVCEYYDYNRIIKGSGNIKNKLISWMIYRFPSIVEKVRRIKAK